MLCLFTPCLAAARLPMVRFGGLPGIAEGVFRFGVGGIDLPTGTCLPVVGRIVRQHVNVLCRYGIALRAATVTDRVTIGEIGMRYVRRASF